MTSSRMRRVDEVIREVLSDTLAQGLQDPRIGFVTVTAVSTSPDLRQARVYVSVLGDDAARAASLEGLSSARGFLQSAINAELRLKRTPELSFVDDETVRRAARLEELLVDQEEGPAS